MTDKPSIESLRACLERVCTGIMDTWDKGQLRAALSELESLRAENEALREENGFALRTGERNRFAVVVVEVVR